MKLPHQRALDILVHRCGTWSRVHLVNEDVCMTLDVGWGYDRGDDVAHITTNCSPGPSPDDELPFQHHIDDFRADEITKIEDVETGTILFDLADI